MAINSIRFEIDAEIARLQTARSPLMLGYDSSRSWNSPKRHTNTKEEAQAVERGKAKIAAAEKKRWAEWKKTPAA